MCKASRMSSGIGHLLLVLDVSSFLIRRWRHLCPHSHRHRSHLQGHLLLLLLLLLLYTLSFLLLMRKGEEEVRCAA